MSGNVGRPFAVGGPRIKVRVTEHDIAWAVRDDSSRCMVARALSTWLGKGTRQARASKEGAKPPPRVFKTRKRTYGARLLRINRPMQATALDEPVSE